MPLLSKKSIGKTGLHAASIGLGCWALAGGWGTGYSDRQVRRVLDTAWQCGVNYFDTANVYGNGAGEEMFNSVPWRHEAVIATKVSAKTKPERTASITDCYSATDIIKRVDESLRRLNREYIDILLLHSWFKEWERQSEYLFETFHRLKREGKAKAVGLSIPDWFCNDIDHLVESGWIDVVQVPYSLFQQWARKMIIRNAQRNEVGVFVRSPLEQGLITDLWHRYGALPPDSFRRGALSRDKLVRIGDRLQEIQRAVGIRPSQLPEFALSFASQPRGICSVIVGMNTRQQVIENTTQTSSFTSEQLSKGRGFSSPEFRWR